jgi:hypothetical protein
MKFRKKQEDRKPIRIECGLHDVNILVIERFAHHKMDQNEFEVFLHHLESELQGARDAYQRRFEEAT